jgi:hypothetical protein
MKHELRAIPPAPRRVRWRPLFAHRWGLLAAGGAMVVLGGLVAWLMFLQSGGKMSEAPRLAAGPSTRVPATVTAVLPPQTIAGGRREEVRYRFRFRDQQGYGRCFLPAGTSRVGDEVEVLVLDADPNVSCIPGGMMHLEHAWLRARFWITVLVTPGGLLLLGWLASVFQLRHVLVHGDVSVAVVHRITPVRFVLPEMLAVDYTFRDHHARTRHNRHWVRAHGELGARLLRQAQQRRYEELPVLHDRRFPHWNRLLLPQDFLPPPTPIELDLPPMDRVP